MPTFDIPIIASIDCASIDAAREAAYKALDHIKIENAAINLANDSRSLSDGRRVVLLHPENDHSNYDQEDHEKAENGAHIAASTL